MPSFSFSHVLTSKALKNTSKTYLQDPKERLRSGWPWGSTDCLWALARPRRQSTPLDKGIPLQGAKWQSSPTVQGKNSQGTLISKALCDKTKYKEAKNDSVSSSDLVLHWLPKVPTCNWPSKYHTKRAHATRIKTSSFTRFNPIYGALVRLRVLDDSD